MIDKKVPAKHDTQRIEKLYGKVSGHINAAKNNIIKTIDTEMVKAYWLTGREIVIEEQQGASRAGYGEYIISNLSKRLQEEFSRGFSVATLFQMKKFFLVYQEDKGKGKLYTVCTQLELPNFSPGLSWSHYRALMRIENLQARQFYEIEASKNNWSVRSLQRQINTLLFERLAMSKDKEGFLELANQGQEIKKPSDTIKSPTILEFLSLPEDPKMKEKDLEGKLIAHMQSFLLELGKGFAFLGRQLPINLDGKRYYPDLVFYHTILKCHVIIDIKIDELDHGDIGQMLFYVNYYDEECRSQGDNPTVGLILCADKSDAMVKYTLGEKVKQIFASKYQFHLPSEEELENELKKELAVIEEQIAENILIE